MMYLRSLSGWFAIGALAMLFISPGLWAATSGDGRLALLESEPDSYFQDTLQQDIQQGKHQKYKVLQKRLLVDTQEQTLRLLQGDQVLYEVKNIAIGSNGTGASRDKRTLDEKTPLGDFTITAIRGSSKFHLFMGFDYPTMDYADAAVSDGRISQEEYEALNNAWHKKLPPPQTTGLGGYFGIHGIGAGNPKVHRLFNWTDGCIALTNEQIESLASMIEVGTLVSIR
ncbi:L,D-transpeptidase family protein [Pseudomaricurvus sp.]|uniref:L,D-transpeptidase family protein n=1 Tax=Pseudomaricurvus sp. TaxID=2004510 RepID=UPI003F6BEF48